MKHYIVIFILLIVGLGCSNDFDITNGTIDVPVVYCLLDPGAETHYVRVEKAFVNEDISGEALAQDPQNLYYDNITVILKNTTKNKEVVAQRVNGEDEGLPREEGSFAQSPNILYKVSAQDLELVSGNIVKLEVRLSDTRVVTAETTIIAAPESRAPRPQSKLMSIVEGKKGSFTWTNRINGTLTTGSMKFNYKEVYPDGSSANKSFQWEPFKNLELERFDYDGAAFYNLVKTQIPVDANVKRFFTGIDYTLTSGGDEIKQYLKISGANLGITSSGEIPFYSNLSEGRGLFSSRAITTIDGISLTGDSLESLRNSEITKDLNFQ